MRWQDLAPENWPPRERLPRLALLAGAFLLGLLQGHLASDTLVALGLLLVVGGALFRLAWGLALALFAGIVILFELGWSWQPAGALAGLLLGVAAVVGLASLQYRRWQQNLQLERQQKERMEERLLEMQAHFRQLGSDYNGNTATLTQASGRILEAACASYYRLQHGQLLLQASWDIPSSLVRKTAAAGHLAYEAFFAGESNELTVQRRLPRTTYAQTEPLVQGMEIQTWVGHPVICQEEKIGYLSVFLQEDKDPLPWEENLLEIIATALGNEEERSQARQYLDYLSLYDSLTGLYNRSFFEAESKRLDTRRQLPLSVIMADANGLKLVNDGFGHQWGNHLLQEVAATVKSACRSEDIVCRWGGDEFAILLPQTAEMEAEGIMNRIRGACASAPQEPIPLSLSLGSATKSLPEQSIHGVIKRAEDRMYRDKLLSGRQVRKTMVSSLQNRLREQFPGLEEKRARMHYYSGLLADEVELSPEQREELQQLVESHDLGLASINPEDEADQPQERGNFLEHCENGYRIAQAIAELAPVAEEILCHHENWDGSGFPQGLAGEDIPFLARVLRVIETYDELHWGPNAAPSPAAALRETAGKTADPELAEALLRAVQRYGHPDQRILRNP